MNTFKLGDKVKIEISGNMYNKKVGRVKHIFGDSIEVELDKHDILMITHYSNLIKKGKM